MGLSEPTETVSREYELDDAENAEVGSVATHSLLWGAVSLAAAIACVVATLAPGSRFLLGGDPRILLPLAAIELSLGVTFVLSGLQFRSAITTKGRDIAHVMTALGHLSRALFVQIIVAGISVALLLGGLGFRAFSH